MLVSDELKEKSQQLAELEEVLKAKDDKLAEAQQVQAELIRKQRELDDQKRDAKEELKLNTTEREETIAGMQQPMPSVLVGGPVLNFCANNYLNLANHPAVVLAAQQGLQEWGYGLASVRFICGTQSIHKQLEDRLTAFLGTETTILYGSCFDANGGLLEALLESGDVIISDSPTEVEFPVRRLQVQVDSFQ